MNNKYKENTKEGTIEYRFVPRTLYDEQIENINLTDTYSKMFSDVDPIF